MRIGGRLKMNRKVSKICEAEVVENKQKTQVEQKRRERSELLIIIMA